MRDRVAAAARTCGGGGVGRAAEVPSDHDHRRGLFRQPGADRRLDPASHREQPAAAGGPEALPGPEVGAVPLADCPAQLLQLSERVGSSLLVEGGVHCGRLNPSSDDEMQRKPCGRHRKRSKRQRKNRPFVSGGAEMQRKPSSRHSGNAATGRGRQRLSPQQMSTPREKSRSASGASCSPPDVDHTVRHCLEDEGGRRTHSINGSGPRKTARQGTALRFRKAAEAQRERPEAPSAPPIMSAITSRPPPAARAAATAPETVESALSPSTVTISAPAAKASEASCSPASMIFRSASTRWACAGPVRDGRRPPCTQGGGAEHTAISKGPNGVLHRGGAGTHRVARLEFAYGRQPFINHHRRPDLQQLRQRLPRRHRRVQQLHRASDVAQVQRHLQVRGGRLVRRSQAGRPVRPAAGRPGPAASRSRLMWTARRGV